MFILLFSTTNFCLLFSTTALWDEEQQLRDRYKVFKVAKLQSLAAKAVRPDSCISITKLAEGGYNKVFRLIMNNRKRVIARIQNLNAGPAFYTTTSEARDFLQIPVPRIFARSATPDNAVSSEYIIIEEVSGTQLRLNPDQKLSIMREVVTIESKMLGVSFSQYVHLLIDKRVRNLIISSALVVYISRAMQWKAQFQRCSPTKLPPNSKKEYIRNSVLGLPSTEAFGIRNARRCRSHGVLANALRVYAKYWLAPQAYLQLLEKYLKVAPTLIDIDPLYLLETKERNPLLAKAFHLDHRKTRRLPVEFAGNTWDDDIVSFREALIDVEKHWQELGIQGECPYHFTQDELHSHSVDAEGWNEVQDFFNSIESLVKRHGWTYPDTFDAAFNFFSELRERGLRHMKGEEKRAFDKQTRWARK
ncbi:hypothetical protein N7530_008445 [Penicillium desertorum]|uniref:Altered inheritance of mitochondria protein 9, mitochondrial n=1 Tax=Penicillium desertorum TaxID=1303715 RepID=A0A9W9WP68_9EURO|nr:hypothetical protein N7530_008445 [Penicillium desertorum]